MSIKLGTVVTFHPKMQIISIPALTLTSKFFDSCSVPVHLVYTGFISDNYADKPSKRIRAKKNNVQVTSLDLYIYIHINPMPVYERISRLKVDFDGNWIDVRTDLTELKMN